MTVYKLRIMALTSTSYPPGGLPILQEEDKPTNCKDCHNFYGTTDKQDLCSACYFLSVFHRTHPGPLTLTYLIENPQIQCPGSRELIQHNIPLLWRIRGNFDPQQDFPSPVRFKILMVLARQCKSSKQLSQLFIEPNHGVMFLSSQAQELLDYFINGKSHDEYEYVHVIAPRVIDPWALRSDHGVLDCYYRDFGEMTTPSSLAKLWWWSSPN
jgi:hypothetical protein